MKTNTITSNDIAKICGVSRSTVSLIMNNRINDKIKISEETKNKVLKTIQEQNYHPNMAARELVMSKSNNIGVTIYQLDYLKELVFSSMLGGAGRVIAENNYNIFICTISKEDLNTQSINFIKKAREKKIDGTIIFDQTITEQELAVLEEMNIPYVLIDKKTELKNSISVLYNYKNLIETVNKNYISSNFDKVIFMIVKERMNWQMYKLILELITEKLSPNIEFIVKNYSIEDRFVLTDDFSKELAGKTLVIMDELNTSPSLQLVTALPRTVKIGGFICETLNPMIAPYISLRMIKSGTNAGEKAAEVLLKKMNKQPYENIVYEDIKIEIDN